MKRILKIVVSILSVALICSFALFSAIQSRGITPALEAHQEENISAHYPLSHRKAIKKSRNSAVQIVSISIDSAYLSSSSGTYFTLFDRYFVLTVLHGIQGPCELTQVSYAGNLYPCKEYAVMNAENDYAIIEVDRIPERDPIEIQKDFPKNSEWKKSYSILGNTVYTGYPNAIGPLTLKGYVIGYSGGEYLYIFSYAYAGASGSGVFDQRGKYIGYIMAIDVGQTEFGVDILENVVLVGAAHKIDWGPMFDFIERKNTQ